jgi:hypothetical protein
MAQLRARVKEGGLPEAAIRSLIYIGLAGAGVDERAFEVIRRIRAGQCQGLSLQEFKANPANFLQHIFAGGGIRRQASSEWRRERLFGRG